MVKELSKPGRLHCAEWAVPALVLLLGGSWVLGQFRVNTQRSVPPMQSGSVRYGGGFQTRALPSEDRFAARSSGLMPSEHRNLSFLSGALPSQGSYTYLARPSPRYGPNWASSYSANGSTRYASPPAYTVGSAWSQAPPAAPYRAGPTNTLIGPNSLARPIPGYTGGSMRYYR